MKSIAKKELLKQVAKGIQSNSTELMGIVSSQFSDSHVACRELICNAYEAGATVVDITLLGDDKLVIVEFRDNGSGMTKKVMCDNFFALFNSSKDGSGIGEYGVGVKSLARFAGQDKLVVTSSTGKNGESWRATTGRLLDNGAITFVKQNPGREAGTTIRVCYHPQTTIEAEARRFVQHARKYCGHLPIRVRVQIAGEGREDLCYDHLGEWHQDARWRCFSRSTMIRGQECRVVISAGSGAQLAFKKQVLVSDSASDLNLFAADLDSDLRPRHVDIRVNYDGFEIPIGRHRIMNTEVLREISSVHRVYLFEFIGQAEHARINGRLNDFGFSATQFDELVTDLLRYDASSEKSWAHIGVVERPNQPRCSFHEIGQEVRQKGLLLLPENNSANFDPNLLPGALISAEQVSGLLALLKETFPWSIVGEGEVFVSHEQHSASSSLTEDENVLQQHLAFRLPPRHWVDKRPAEGKESGEGAKARQAGMALFDSMMTESSTTSRGLGTYKIELGRLEDVKQQPVASRYYKLLGDQQKVVLNLNHPYVKSLVQLARGDANLAAHYAICLLINKPDSEIRSLLKTESDLLLESDIIARVVDPEGLKIHHQSVRRFSRGWLDFKRDSASGKDNRGEQ